MWNHLPLPHKRWKNWLYVWRFLFSRKPRETRTSDIFRENLFVFCLLLSVYSTSVSVEKSVFLRTLDACRISIHEKGTINSQHSILLFLVWFASANSRKMNGRAAAKTKNWALAVQTEREKWTAWCHVASLLSNVLRIETLCNNITFLTHVATSAASAMHFAATSVPKQARFEGFY